MESTKFHKIILEYKRMFCARYLNDSGYNFFYSKCLQHNNEMKPSLSLISYWFIIGFDEELREYFIQTDFKVPILLQTDLKMLVNRCNDIPKLLCDNIKEFKFDKDKFYYLLDDLIALYSNKLYEYVLDAKTGIIKDINVQKYMLDAFYEKKKKNKKKYPLLKDIVGLEEAKKVFMEKVIKPIKYKKIYDKYNLKNGGGLLLYGLPGTGKTMFAQAIANEIDAEFFSITSSDLKLKWFGDSEKQIKQLFDEAKSHKVAIIFFDEFESIGVSRDKTNELTSSILVPELLAQMQGFERNENLLLVIAATNRPWDIDSALLRPGRFDSMIYIELPNFELRKLMFEKQLKNVKVEDDVIEYLASKTEMFNGADINNICDSLLRIVVNKEIEKRDSIEICFEDCVEVLKKNKSSVNKMDVIKMNNFKNSL